MTYKATDKEWDDMREYLKEAINDPDTVPDKLIIPPSPLKSKRPMDIEELIKKGDILTLDWIKLNIPEDIDEYSALWVCGTPHGYELPYAYPYRLYIMDDRVELCTQGIGHRLYTNLFTEYPIDPPTHIELIIEAEKAILMHSL